MTPRPQAVVVIDTSTDDVVVGAASGEEMLFEAVVGRDRERFPRHASMLLAEAERAAESAGGWEAVGRIGIGVGPGSFTGLRIGIATGRALAQALALPAVPLGSLTVLARGIAERAGRGTRPCLAAIDARRGEFFVQLHDPRGHPLSQPAVVAPESVGAWLAGAGGSELAGAPTPALAGGSGALRFAGELEAAGVEVLAEDDPAHRLAPRPLCELAASASPSRPEAIRPVYLREPDARRWLDRDRS